MKRLSIKKQVGFGITESLIGLVVLSFGLIAIFGAHSSFMKGFTDDKSRQEALQIASSVLEEIRKDAIDGGSFNLSGGYTDQLEEGERATYKKTLDIVSAVATEVSETYKVTSTVKWDSIYGGTENVTLNTYVKLQDPTAALSITQNGEDTTYKYATNNILSPVGQAEYGTIDDELSDNASELVGFEGLNGVKVYLDNKDALYKLVDGDQVLLKSSNQLVRISGKIFVDIEATGADIDELGTLYAGAPDISYCQTSPYNVIQGSSKYYQANYICYFGQQWYGSIGVVAKTKCSQYEKDGDCKKWTGPDVTDSLACVGDPTQSVGDVLTNDFSRDPQSSLTRKYLGYKEALEGGERIIVGDTATKYVITGLECNDLNGCQFQNHHMYFSGTTSCSDSMNALASVTDYADIFEDNPGKNYCLSDFCPKDVTSPYGIDGVLKVYLVEGTDIRLKAENITQLSFNSFDSLRSIKCDDMDEYFSCHLVSTVSPVGESYVADSEWSGTLEAELKDSSACYSDTDDQTVSGSTVTKNVPSSSEVRLVLTSGEVNGCIK